MLESIGSDYMSGWYETIIRVQKYFIYVEYKIMNGYLLIILFASLAIYVIILNWDCFDKYLASSFEETVERFNIENAKQPLTTGPLIEPALMINNLFNPTSKVSEVCKETPHPLKCAVNTCGSGILHPILDPQFNFREVAKQCLLLEDHLNNSRKRCLDCIRKHFLIIDGLLEESVSLEKDNRLRDQYRELYIRWIDLEKEYASDNKSSDNLDNISKKIRLFRKPLVEKYFDIVKDYDSLQSSDQSTDQSSDQPPDQSADQPADKQPDQPSDQPPVQSSDQPPVQSSYQSDNRM